MGKVCIMAGWNLDVEEPTEPAPVPYRTLVATSPEVGPNGPLEILHFRLPVDVAEQVAAKLRGSKVDVVTNLPTVLRNGHTH